MAGNLHKGEEILLSVLLPLPILPILPIPNMTTVLYIGSNSSRFQDSTYPPHIPRLSFKN